MKRVTVIAPVGSPSERVRMRKLVDVLEGMGITVDFWGWSRLEVERKREVTGELRILMKGGGTANKRLVFLYPRWMARVFRAARSVEKDRHFYCLSFDTAFPLAVLSLFGKRRFVFDNADNITMSYRWPGPIKKVFQAMERYAVRKCDVHLVPSADRWPHDDGNRRIVKNYPTRDILEKARAIQTTQQPRDESVLTVYANGRLIESRGTGVLLEALRKVKSGKVRLLVAGRLLDDSAKKLSELPIAEYAGLVNQEQSLALYARADVTITYYDPSVEINRLAEPNKWGDCIAMNTAFVVNEEVQTARDFVAADACFALPFHDSDALAALLDSLATDKARVDIVRSNLTKFPFMAWDDRVQEVIGAWLESGSPSGK